ncbi:Ldh family oxidoreductase [Actinomycetospora aeridis]|uniref:Ldh family oxidoreductase n=1 Tax=Actinomycetospora aeridis TaxID=3129231 RepID=A0ABU8N4Q6_9PSEU
MILLGAGELSRFAAACFTGLGIPDADAALVAEVLVHADLRGLDSHGTHRLPAYLERVAKGLARDGSAITVAAGSGAVRRLDAGGALGPLAAVRATDLAVALAREHGLGLVAVRRSTHLGAAGFYAHRAAAGHELVAIVSSTAPASVAPVGAATPFLGTDPLAIGIPLGRHGTFVHDMGTGPSRARVRRAAQEGRALAPGTALDASGRPTDDAAEALLGTLLPVAGAKGSGLGTAITLLAGLLGGAAFDDEIAPTYPAEAPQDIGHVVVVVDPWRLQDRASGLGRLEAVVDRLHALPTVDGVERVRFPGERAAATAAHRSAEGIPVPAAELRRWAAAAEAHGLHDAARWVSRALRRAG